MHPPQERLIFSPSSLGTWHRPAIATGVAAGCGDAEFGPIGVVDREIVGFLDT